VLCHDSVSYLATQSITLGISPQKEKAVKIHATGSYNETVVDINFCYKISMLRNYAEFFLQSEPDASGLPRLHVESVIIHYHWSYTDTIVVRLKSLKLLQLIKIVYYCLVCRLAFRSSVCKIIYARCSDCCACISRAVAESSARARASCSHAAQSTPIVNHALLLYEQRLNNTGTSSLLVCDPGRSCFGATSEKRRNYTKSSVERKYLLYLM
jgi:hypothetical protein